MAVNWQATICDFFRSPSRFVSSKSADVFLAELLHELRNDRVPNGVKVHLLAPLCEQPALLCPTLSAGEETVLELLSVFAHCRLPCVPFRSSLLVALTSVLICSSCVSTKVRVCVDFLDLLLQIAQDTSASHADAALLLRGVACECLRELETCRPGLLSQRLELIGELWSKENSRLHQPYARLNSLVLKNAVYRLAVDPGSGNDDLKLLLGEKEREAERQCRPTDKEAAAFSSLAMGTMPTLQTGQDCKDLRTVLSTTLENSFLLTPPCQAEVLRTLVQVVAMVPVVRPSIFRAQLLRLLGTGQVCLLHVTLLMKCAYTDSLFSTDDEAFVLRRLVLLSQHPLLSKAEQLFFLDCMLHFPENRPIGCGIGVESLPVLLTPQLAYPLWPAVLHDDATMLARFNLLLLLHQEEGERDGDGEEGATGLVLLYQHLGSLLDIVTRGHGPKMAVAFFRALFLFLVSFCHVHKLANSLADQLCALYGRRSDLALHLLNLADRTRDSFPERGWSARLCGALQRVIVEAPPAQFTVTDLRWHLKVLARVAEEGHLSQLSTLRLLADVTLWPRVCTSADWRLGNGVLRICRRLMAHPGLDALLPSLADVLQHLMRHYGDADIGDHARLYYSLLTTLSKEKLAAGMATRALSEEGANKHSLSCIVADTERLTSMLTVHRTDEAAFRLAESEYPQPSPSETEGCCPRADAYGLAGRKRSHLTLKYQLHHSVSKLSCSDQVFSLHLRFNFRGSHYEQLCDLSVPCLFPERLAPAVELLLKPRLAVPVTLSASAMFSTVNDLSWYTVLPDIHVCFRQALLPLAGGTLNKLPLFQDLWDQISEEEQADYARALFCCQLQAQELRSAVENQLRPFMIPDSAKKDEFKLFFFIPPQFHILLKIISQEDAVHCRIATDNWRLLPHIGSFLANLFTKPLPKKVAEVLV
ncbi:AP-5 complex subunit beta-1 isoform X1 [Syngnathus typhle]|uniref:AP-5 complex subunit beta-1 isoform X1 n=1 Tax=Syngnathus typhle TaxID=161592 RepID=UPI002A6B2071|nr:AP-5 complex subunit beta-1 isoform X1 [Syngnathus typhle]